MTTRFRVLGNVWCLYVNPSSRKEVNQKHTKV